jgi:predicted permease
MKVDVGFDATGLVAIDVAPPLTVRAPADIARFYRDLLGRVGENPAVASAAVASKLPLLSGPTTRPTWVEDAPPVAGTLPQIFPLVEVSAGYFATMNIPLLAGRTLSDANVARGENEAVVGSAFAMRYWNDPTGTSALGRRFRPYADGPWYTIVGVAADVRDTALTSSRSAILYLPEEPSADTVVGTRPSRGMSLVMRVRGDPSRLAETVERDLRSWSPGMIVFEPRLMSDVVSAAGSTARFVLFLLAIGATCTLLLGIIGLYGVIAYLVSLRTREIGIRIALGLVPSRAAAMILRQGIAIIATGAVAGVTAFVGFSTLLRTLVFGVSTSDAPSLEAAALVVIGVAAIATWIPARRAARIDPAEALRAD